MHKMKPAQTHSGLRQPSGLRLRAPFGSNYLVEPDDILDTKRALMALDYYQPLHGTEPGAFVDNDLFAGIKQFQRDHGLKVDGFMRPGGETEAALNAVLRHADPSRPVPDGEGANDNQPPANENEPGWDEAGRWKGPRGPWWKRGPDKGPIQDERKDDKPIVPGGPKPSSCDVIFALDMEKCRRRFPFPKDKPGFIECESQAQKSYSDCLANRKVPEPSPPGKRPK
jgi:hypothetical protein